MHIGTISNHDGSFTIDLDKGAITMSPRKLTEAESFEHLLCELGVPKSHRRFAKRRIDAWLEREKDRTPGPARFVVNDRIYESNTRVHFVVSAREAVGKLYRASSGYWCIQDDAQKYVPMIVGGAVKILGPIRNVGDRVQFDMLDRTYMATVVSGPSSDGYYDVKHDVHGMYRVRINHA